MSPEMLSRSGHGFLVDLYSLGVLLFEMLTGLTPHYSTNRQEMYNKILNDPISIPSYVPCQARSLLEGLLRKDPKERFGRRGLWEVKRHPYLADIDWHKLLKGEASPPFKPSIKGSNFDEEYISMEVNWSEDEEDIDYEVLSVDKEYSKNNRRLSGLSNKKTFSISNDRYAGNAAVSNLFTEYTFNKDLIKTTKAIKVQKDANPKDNESSLPLFKVKKVPSSKTARLEGDTKEPFLPDNKLRGIEYKELIKESHLSLGSHMATIAPKFITHIYKQDASADSRNCFAKCGTYRSNLCTGLEQPKHNIVHKKAACKSGYIKSKKLDSPATNKVFHKPSCTATKESEALRPLPSVISHPEISSILP
eukprot:TRINITY_DN1869_c0_g2_i12.p1 TRINITY_DN1869_c0_g2~~TRINITY_DN1869_c0_g2_i12.p1  ORF type:complete len:363 (+),score=26.75 TRINITY_DN1869_c0_g2_i12:1092-2180(+)